MTGLPLRRLATADVGLTVALTIALMGGCVREAQFGDDRGPDGGLLVGHWALDEASGAVAADSSGFGNHGSYEGSLTPTALAAPLLFANPRGLAFDQATNEDVLIPSSASLGLSGPLTLAAWIHPTGEATTQQGIIEKWDSETSGPAANAARGYEFRVTQEQTLRVVLLAEPGHNVELAGTTPVAPGVWTHVAATYDGVALRLFVNGSEDATISAATAPTAGSSPLHIGRDYGDNGFQGNIDDVRIYRRALGADEVLALAHGEDVPG